MKFLCDSCQAQYQIADEKIGPAGVRVRCKKCGHVIYVKRAESQEAPPDEDSTAIMTPEVMAKLRAGIEAAHAVREETKPVAAPDPAKLADLDKEIGSALDSMFSDGGTALMQAPPVAVAPKAAEPSVPAPAPASLSGFKPSPVTGLPEIGAGPGPEDDRAETRIFTSVDMEKIAGDPAPAASPGSSKPDPQVAPVPASSAPAGNEWFIAVRDEQLGPIPIEQIKQRFEAGEVDGDTLVWSAGLTDWRPLSSVEALAEEVLPKRDVVRTARQVAVPGAEGEARREAVTFKPSAASALAALASLAKEEIAVSAKEAPPPPRGNPNGAPTGHANTLLAGLMSPSPDVSQNAAKIPPPTSPSGDFGQSPLARYRGKPVRGGSKILAWVGISLAVLALAAIAAGYFFIVKPNQETAARLERERQAAIAAAAAAAQQAKETPPSAPEPPKPQAPAPVAQAPVPVPTPAPTPQAAPPAPQPKATAERDHGKHDHFGNARHPEKSESPTAAPSHPAPEPEKPAAKSSDDFLGGTDVDKEFAKELDGKGGGDSKQSRHGPYIPPPPGQADLPQNLSQSDIVEVVKNHRDVFAKCVQDQKRRDPNSSGTVVMRWKIKPDGRTTDVVARGDDAESPLAGCFKAQIKSLHFGQYRGPQMSPIDFPFNY